jgi:hypothetical protein
MINLNPKEIDKTFEYFFELRSRYADSVLQHFTELTTHVSNTSKGNWFLQLDWKKVREKELIGLYQALLCFEVMYPETIKDEILYFTDELYSQLFRTKQRMLGAKHLNFQFPADQLEELREAGEVEYLALSEYKGNYEIDVREVLSKLFRIRYHRSPRTRKTNRPRGYRDKGSESSESEKARRAANTSTWNPYLEEVYQYCLRTGCHPREALRLFNMEPRGR